MNEHGSDHPDQQKEALQYQHWQAEYQLWRQKHLPPTDALALLRSEAREVTAVLQEPMRAWIMQSYGLLLPDHIFTFWTFWLGLGPIEREAITRFIYPAGLFSFFEEGGRERTPREGLDHRLAWRYYLDPPEFLTVLTGDADGLHYGLWYDTPHALPSFVAGYYSRDADAIRYAGRTLLEVLHATVERTERDWYPPANVREGEEDLFPTWLLRDAITEYETIDQRERGNASLEVFIHDALQERLATYNGIGVRVPPPYNQSVPQPCHVVYEAIRSDAPEVTTWITEAEQACEKGQPAFALVLGHDLHWLSAGQPHREEAAWRLLTRAYEVLGYDALATIATLHHQHRNLPSVQIY
ncbi:ADP-ribosylation family protein [Ktedonobacter racemifer]|uniref:Uncharacterized protein n=1 Tax=Ktedonobacter racemifer DSM 44963 TaxID=485913 RepID=D6U5R5_KTERA|nr:ADP-ribosylation family protein [Ktedonobacter racemifer]EFH80326.1 Protein of unknown function DUF2228 [Ktedonobacter racemifer DSM 44963]